MCEKHADILEPRGESVGRTYGYIAEVTTADEDVIIKILKEARLDES